MCGIAGILDLNGNQPPRQEELIEMGAMVIHRGPDEAGLFIDDHCGMVHTRLSIIDLSGGTQPISNEDGTLWIVFNGEIFNYVELQKELLAAGHQFQTDSDTEVILHLFEDEGENCLQRLNGQFAFAIYNTITSDVFLARDRAGIRPLFYTRLNNRFYFASEVKSLFALPEIPRDIDPQALNEIFTFWAPLSGRSAFKSVQEVPAGHFMTVSKGEAELKRYWQFEYSAKPAGEQEAVQAVRELLVDAVRLRLRADVPVGTYLSGGLDSSGVTSIVKNKFNNRLRTFGIRFQEGEFDEGRYQQEMVNWLHTEHSELLARNDEIATVFADVIWHCEKPILRTSPVPLFLLSRLVRESGFKVVLTGEGADEVFGGYNIFRETKVRRFWAKQPQSRWRPELLARLYPYILNDPKLKGTLAAFFKQGLEQPDGPLFSHLVRWRSTSRLKSFFSDDLKQSIADNDPQAKLVSGLPAEFYDWDAVTRAQYLESTIFLSNYLLSSQGDRVAMAHSVEIRLPFLDYRLIELVSSLPSALKIKVLNEKYILKQALKPFLPDSVRLRPKHPYRAPITQSLLTGNCELESYLTVDKLRETGLFDPKKVNRLLQKILRFQRPGEFDAMGLTGILSAQIIADQFGKNFHTRRNRSIKMTRIVDHSTSAKAMA